MQFLSADQIKFLISLLREDQKYLENEKDLDTIYDLENLSPEDLESNHHLQKWAMIQSIINCINS
jgi:hypothetical protein